jgi:hypothetical protein
MTWKPITLILAAGVLVWVAIAAENTSDKSHKLTSVSIRKLADSLHAVIAADRQSYSELIAQQLDADERRVPTVENGRQNHGLPVHAQMLRRAAAIVQRQGAEFSYTLRSLWPINPSDGPQTQAEQAGLDAVTKNPEQPYYTDEELGGRSYFTAVYADRATLSSCVSCHNQHPRSPKKDFKEGDVMGAIVVRVPLEF